MITKTFDLDLNNPTNTLKMHIEMLKMYRNTTDKPDELEWEIRLYEYMLNSADMKKLYDDYNRIRYEDTDAPPLEKREVVERLGWVVT